MTSTRAVHCPRHERYRGICPACQRARLTAEQRQLAEVRAIRTGDSEACGVAVVPFVRHLERRRVS
jgi:hypothetical protein